MAKISIFDPYMFKFTKDMVDWWRGEGHEVRIDRYYDPDMVDWADIVWFETVDNNYKAASNPHEALLSDWDKERKKDIPWGLGEMDLSQKKIILRPIDIEVWQGAHAACVFKYVNEYIFIAPHIRDIMMADSRPNESDAGVHVIPCSVNLDRYRYAERAPGFDIAVISEKWVSKGTDLILQIALKLKQIDPRYKIHWLGKYSDYHWEVSYFDDFVKHNDLNIEFTDWIEGDDAVDNFLEGKNYLLHASHKEAFSYATAEAMAKGIRPIVHRFFGADALWPDITWSSIDEAVDMITDGDYDSAAYRQYLIDHEYTTPQMMKRIQDVIDGV